MATAEQQQSDERSIEHEYPFTAVLSEDGCETLDMVHRHIAKLVDEYKLHITEDGWSFRVVDAANVGMFDVSIPTSVFSEYHVTEDMEVGMDVSRLNDALNADERITYGFTSNLPQQHKEDYTGPSESQQREDSVGTPDGEPQFTVGDTSVTAIDPDSIRMEPDLPDLDLPTTAVIEDIELFDHFCANTGSHIQISGSDEGIALHCEKDVSHDTLLLPDGNGSEVREYPQENSGETLHERVADMHGHAETDVSLFPQDYLEDVFKGLLVKHKRDVSYELQLGTEFPLKLHRRDDTDVEFTFMLAPRIEGT